MTREELFKSEEQQLEFKLSVEGSVVDSNPVTFIQTRLVDVFDQDQI